MRGSWLNEAEWGRAFHADIDKQHVQKLWSREGHSSAFEQPKEGQYGVE